MKKEIKKITLTEAEKYINILLNKYKNYDGGLECLIEDIKKNLINIPNSIKYNYKDIEDMSAKKEKEFYKKIARFEKIRTAGWDYVYHTLKDARLTDGFWNKYGYKIDNLLNDFKENYRPLWIKYNKNDKYCLDLNVEDYFC